MMALEPQRRDDPFLDDAAKAGMKGDEHDRYA
jgi:hypothetical protein